MTEQRFTLAEASAFGTLTGRIAKLERERKSIDDQLTRCCQLRDALLGHPRDGHWLGAAAYSQATIDWWLSRFRPAPPVLPEEAQPMTSDPDPDLGPCGRGDCTAEAVAYVSRTVGPSARLTVVTGPRAVALADGPATADATVTVCYEHAGAALDDLLREAT